MNRPVDVLMCVNGLPDGCAIYSSPAHVAGVIEQCVIGGRKLLINIINDLRTEHAANRALLVAIEERLTSEAYSEPVTMLRRWDVSAMLPEEIKNAPDDAHHYRERRLFRTLCARLGRPRFDGSDLDVRHENLRRRRFNAMEASDRRREAVRRAQEFLIALREQMDFEEQELYPLLERFLTAEDWSLLEEEFSAYRELQRGAWEHAR